MHGSSFLDGVMVVGCAQYAIIVTHPSRHASLAVARAAARPARAPGSAAKKQNAKMRVAFSIGCEFF